MKKQKISPVIVVIGLIILIGIVGVITMIVQHFQPTKEKADLKAYYGITGEDQAALILNDKVLETGGMVQNEEIYLRYEDVATYLDTGFYWDESVGQMLLTTADTTQTLTPDDGANLTENGAPIVITGSDGAIYLALSSITKYTDMDCSIYEQPKRAVMRTNWSGRQSVTAKQDGVVRLRGGLKSPVLTEVKAGDTMDYLEDLGDWVNVSTADGAVGYIESSKVSEAVEAPVHKENTNLEFTSLQKNYKINLAWHQVTNQEGNAALAPTVAETKGLTTISPTWFSITDNAGTLSSLASREYVDQAHGMGLEVWALVDNFNTEISTTDILKNKDARTNIINQLLQSAESCGFDGINIDFERLGEDASSHYIQFLRELTQQAHTKSLVISVDNPVPQNYNMYYKRGQQGKIVDYVINMGYDEHYSGSEEAGSVSSLPFVKDSIVQTLKEVPARKVINAIPFYTRLWTVRFGQQMPESEAIGMDKADAYVSQLQMNVVWDESVGQNVATAEDSDAQYYIWMEDEKSLEEKMKLVQEYELAGAAEWKLGFERDSVWDIISQYLK
ncbi:MAG: glycosyl hydrolase family 18 protein [Lachnospiraceae bacterium]|nr:glycosyl hydrolase family 18 protein [Lachnospiraceae bacterium]